MVPAVVLGSESSGCVAKMGCVGCHDVEIFDTGMVVHDFHIYFVGDPGTVPVMVLGMSFEMLSGLVDEMVS